MADLLYNKFLSQVDVDNVNTDAGHAVAWLQKDSASDTIFWYAKTGNKVMRISGGSDGGISDVRGIAVEILSTAPDATSENNGRVFQWNGTDESVYKHGFIYRVEFSAGSGKIVPFNPSTPADWNEADAESDAYIRNKPELIPFPVNDSTGKVGQVLKKTADGVMWSDDLLGSSFDDTNSMITDPSQYVPETNRVIVPYQATVLGMTSPAGNYYSVRGEDIFLFEDRTEILMEYYLANENAPSFEGGWIFIILDGKSAGSADRYARNTVSLDGMPFDSVKKEVTVSSRKIVVSGIVSPDGSVYAVGGGDVRFSGSDTVIGIEKAMINESLSSFGNGWSVLVTCEISGDSSGIHPVSVSSSDFENKNGYKLNVHEKAVIFGLISPNGSCYSINDGSVHFYSGSTVLDMDSYLLSEGLTEPGEGWQILVQNNITSIGTGDVSSLAARVSELENTVADLLSRIKALENKK